MWNELLMLFKRISPKQYAEKELLSAQHERLVAQSTAEHAASITAYNDKRIARLTRFIQEQTA